MFRCSADKCKELRAFNCLCGKELCEDHIEKHMEQAQNENQIEEHKALSSSFEIPDELRLSFILHLKKRVKLIKKAKNAILRESNTFVQSFLQAQHKCIENLSRQQTIL